MGEYIRKTARYNGKKYEATGKTELEAMTKLAEKLAAAKRGEEAIGGSMTVTAWYRQWKATYKDPKGLTKKSLGMYDEKFNGYIKPAIGSMKLKDVKDVHLQRILNGQAGRSASHVKKLRMVMQEMFKRARQSRLIPYDPAELLELPHVQTHQRRSITEEERAAILAVAEHHRAGLWVLTLLYTGMRPGETAAMSTQQKKAALRLSKVQRRIPASGTYRSIQTFFGGFRTPRKIPSLLYSQPGLGTFRMRTACAAFGLASKEN